MLLDLDLPEITLRLINVYATNVDNPTFFKFADYIEQSPETYTLLCGDLNVVLDPKMDSKNYINVNKSKRLK